MSEMTVTSHDDGTVTIQHAPAVQEFSTSLLAKAAREFVQIDGDDITITAANGTWVYRIFKRDEGSVTATRISGPVQ